MAFDIREAMAILSAGTANLEGRTGGESDARQMLAGAMAGIEPRWAGEILFAKYAGDGEAAKIVERALLCEFVGWVWPNKSPPGTLRTLTRMAVAEHCEPPPCHACAGTGRDYQLIDGAVAQASCGACNGHGRRRQTAEENAELSGLPWDQWGHHYAKLLVHLRRMERAAVERVAENWRDG